MMDYRQIEIDKNLKSMFDEIDDSMEEKYKGNWRLHPNRLARGKSANKESDGLFNIGVAFTPGYGSQYGRGYAMDVSISTLDRIPLGMKKKLYLEVSDLVSSLLPKYFPNRKLEIVKDGKIYKIIGDFSLGMVGVSF